MKSIIVNATALDHSGALSILRQFIENIPEDDNNWIIFTSSIVDVYSENEKVRIVPIKGVKPVYRRFLWDAWGLKKWLRTNGIEPIAGVSLQNTGFNMGENDVPSFIYYHQSIPFYPFSWNPLKKEERALWFYKNIYPFFIKLFLSKQTVIFVQLDYIKSGFAKLFNHPLDRIHIYSPSVKESENKETIAVNPSTLNLFYPATGFSYKNHRTILEAVDSIADVTLYLTLPKDKQFPDNVKCLGTISFERVQAMYRKCDALLFPSYIETYGLPLLEAALTGLPLIVADLPYSREVLAGYEGAIFVPYHNASKWREAIEGLKKGKRYPPIVISHRKGWKELFNDIKENI